MGSQIDFSKITFRCSQIGKLIGDYKSSITEKQLEKLNEYYKKEKLTEIQKEEMERLIAKRDAPKELPDVCTTYLKELYFKVTKGWEQEISSKYMEKGNMCEQDGITLLQNSLFKNLNFPILKNKKRFENDYIKGYPDVIIGDIIVDVKNCWDWLTLENSDLSNLYEWQLRGYMDLCKSDTGILFYCLVNLPDYMVFRECEKHFYNSNKYLTKEDSDFIAKTKKIQEMFRFDKFPKEQRFKAFTVECDAKKVDFLYKRIDECRAWLQNFHNKQLENYKNNLLITA